MPDKLSKAEIRKDALQEGVTAASHAVGSVATIVTTAVGDVARTLGGLATEIFEIRDSARRAGRDHEIDDEGPTPAPGAGTVPGPVSAAGSSRATEAGPGPGPGTVSAEDE